MDWIKRNRYPKRVEFLLYVVESNQWNHLTYPMNYLRNIAIKRTQTTHYMVLDMDEWISSTLEAEINRIPPSILANEYNVIIVPLVMMNDILITDKCCSYNDCLQMYSFLYYQFIFSTMDLVPNSMSMLYNCYQSGYCQFKRGHSLFTHVILCVMYNI